MRVKIKLFKLPPFIVAAVVICIGIALIILQPHEELFRIVIGKEAELVKGASLYDQVWKNVDMRFEVHLFHVKNPEDVMEGEYPRLVEHGPYVYDMNVKKNILRVDEEADEIEFTTTRMMHFNKELSGGSEDDELTIINSGYIATIGSIQAKFAMFMAKIGNDIHKLFPDMEDIFVRGKAGDFMFGGLPMVCDPVKYPELKMICGFFGGKLPDSIKRTNVEGVYTWSFFGMLNGTEQGPFTVNRGLKNKTMLGSTTSFKGKRKQRLWGKDECNQVRGSDSVTWAPMREKPDFLYTFESQICRSAIVDFTREEIIHGLVGWRYEFSAKSWDPDLFECYCPQKRKVPVCPIRGVMELTACQEAPLYYSEPHFLHGDPSLLDYAKGLSPDPKIHTNFITIEPYSGAPLGGSKSMQLSAKVFKSPVVTMLANVSDGYLPMLWVKEYADSTVESFADIIQSHRFLRLAGYFIYLPLPIGILLLIKAIFLFDVSSSDTIVAPLNSTNSPLIRTIKINEPDRSIRRNRESRVNPSKFS